jgi:hypothetical protein
LVASHVDGVDVGRVVVGDVVAAHRIVEVKHFVRARIFDAEKGDCPLESFCAYIRNIFFLSSYLVPHRGGGQRRTDAAFCFTPGGKHQSRLVPVTLAP